MASSKVLAGGTIAVLSASLATSVGGFWPSLDLLIVSNLTLDLARIGMIALLSAMLVTNPPRPMMIRAVAGSVAAFTAVAAVALFFNYLIGVWDALIFSLVAILLAIDAVEAPSWSQAKNQKKIIRAN